MTAPLANTYRFFVAPAALAHDHVTLDDSALARQLGRVLRLKPGDRVLLLDGAGTACVVRLTEIGREQISGTVVQRHAAGGEPATVLTLYVGLLRAERFEWVLQKGTELGVSAFVPVQWSRSLPADAANERKRERWQRIIREAAEQACRGRLPALHPPLSLPDACAQAAHAERALLLWEGSAPPLRHALRQPDPSPRTLAVLSGPEGGIEPAELTSATGHGIMPVSLGSRILRAETAPIVAATAIFYEYEREEAPDD
jgi:16S rRNA (uracil1498-N3)-methyltransferase